MSKKLCLIGNPNVGKSTIFNALTKLNEHTGNWTGKTVSVAEGNFKYKDTDYKIYDLPGTYSLNSKTDEEEVTSNFICFNNTDKLIIVIDSIVLKRNLNLVLQVLETNKNTIVCLNMYDEAVKRNIKIDIDKLKELLNVNVILTNAKSNVGLNKLLKELDVNEPNNFKINYSDELEKKIKEIENKIDFDTILPKRFIALKLLENNFIKNKLFDIYPKLKDIKIDKDFEDEITKTIVTKSNEITNETLFIDDKNKIYKNKKIDKLLTNKITSIPIMIISLLFIFYLTITFSNYPSNLLFKIFSSLEDNIYYFFEVLYFPKILNELIVFGAYRVTYWVVSVMLPPMCIFFPLFSLLEESGFLPRIAFNLDGICNKCNTCGKQSLTMCMSFGCNAVGITGTRIIDSKREKLIAILTNNFIPCNGRFPTIIALISIFLVDSNNKLLSSLILTLFILFSIIITFLTSKVLSKTILKGYPSSFILELPHYRKPDYLKVIIRSLKDKAFNVLKRAIIVSMPAGILIFIISNININNISLLKYIINLLNPIGNIIGLDGTILSGFILGIPANEIVLPITLMGYLNTNSMIDINNLETIKTILINNNWTIKTAICTIIFSLIHYPCATTLLTIKKETNSIKWTIISFILPTIIGITICFIINLI